MVTATAPPKINANVGGLQVDVSNKLPDWALPLIQKHYRNKVLYGGRGGGKSQNVARALVILAASKPLRIACTREFQSSIRESTKLVIEEAIRDLNLQHFFKIERSNITGKNGSYFFFHGIEGSREGIRSWQSIDICWVEEAQRLTMNSYEILRPTIRGSEKAELWFTFNPRYRTDPVYASFVARTPPNSYIINVNYNDNPWFPNVLEEERSYCEVSDPQRYRHIWLGEPDDTSITSKVITYGDLEKCVDAHKKLDIFINQDWKHHAGLDVADSGGDGNALVLRRGPLIYHVEMWRASTLGQTSRHADAMCNQHDVRRLYYDGGGLGAGVRSYMNEMRGGRNYGAYPINFGSAVTGPEKPFGFRTKNKHFFARRNSQMAWNLRLRVHQTGRLLNGEKVNPADCLFIDSKCTSRLEEMKNHFVQPEWKENPSGQVVIDKDPEEIGSPDMFDAACLAFAYDSKMGLRLPRGLNRISYVTSYDDTDSVMDVS